MVMLGRCSRRREVGFSLRRRGVRCGDSRTADQGQLLAWLRRDRRRRIEHRTRGAKRRKGCLGGLAVAAVSLASLMRDARRSVPLTAIP